MHFRAHRRDQVQLVEAAHSDGGDGLVLGPREKLCAELRSIASLMPRYWVAVPQILEQIVAVVVLAVDVPVIMQHE